MRWCELLVLTALLAGCAIKAPPRPPPPAATRTSTTAG